MFGMQTLIPRRRRLAVLTLTLALLALALAPLGASARTATPVLSGGTAGGSGILVGGSCATAQFFDYSDATYFPDGIPPFLSADPAIFGFDAAAANQFTVETIGAYIRTSMGQRVFSVAFRVTVYTGDQYNELYWSGLAAVKCLSGGVLQFAFKPQVDQYRMHAGQYPDYDVDICGDLGGNARLTATIDTATNAFEIAAYAPVVPHLHAAGDCLNII
jgi:hypothetical protein